MEIEKPKRIFVAEDQKVNAWEDIKMYFESLQKEPIETVSDLKTWLKKRSELDAFLEENLAWRYIKMTINTSDEAAANNYKQFITEINPHIAPEDHKLNEKMLDSPSIEDLEKESEAFFIMIRGVKKAAELFREENVPLQTEESEKAQVFGTIAGKQSIVHDGEEMTMQKAASLLREQDRALREEIFKKTSSRRLQDENELNDLFDELIALRTKIAKNAGFDNYRDYAFEAMGRFDYSVQDCLDFHQAVEHHIVPLCRDVMKERASKLGVDQLKPWDTQVDPEGKDPLKPFQTADELVKKTVSGFNHLDPFFGECIATLDQMGHLDLESKKGKAPGGYNYPLYEIGVPFIFMNAVGTAQDLITMVHEGGHAIHSILTKDLEYTSFKSFPSEVAELASMSMELLSMEHWDVFYEGEDLERARHEQITSTIKALPWIAQIDAFQHWIYTHPEHTRQERTDQWLDLSERFGTGLVDWSGYEDVLATNWQRQLHLFEVPFYYIEYGFAQLGAIAVWRNYSQNSSKALKDYREALSVGYQESIPSIYETAGIKFDFSDNYVKGLGDYLKTKMNPS